MNHSIRKDGDKDGNYYFPLPLKELVHVIAKAVVEDYRQEIQTKAQSNHESSPLRKIQQR